jgi:hypothetical protein
MVVSRLRRPWHVQQRSVCSSMAARLPYGILILFDELLKFLIQADQGMFGHALVDRLASPPTWILILNLFLSAEKHPLSVRDAVHSAYWKDR